MGYEIRSARLVLSPAEMAEAAEIEALLGLEDVRRYLSDGVAMPRARVENLIAGSTASFAERGLGLWVARERGARPIIGLTGFCEVYTPPVFELLFALRPSHWHQGLATEMARAAVDQAFRHAGLETVRASTDAPNQASVRLLTRLGMRPDGRTSVAEGKGILWDQLHFTIGREEWEARPTGGPG